MTTSAPRPPQRLAAAVLAAAVLAGAAPAHAQALRYQLDPAHSFVQFEVLHFGTATLRGRLGPLAGEVLLDRGALRGRVQLAIATAGVSTGVPALDARLRGAELFDSAAYPQAFFVAERFAFDAEGGVQSVRGEFTLRGVGVPLTLTAQRFGCYPHPLLQREVCGGDFTAELLRSPFGMTLALPWVADRVRLQVQVEALLDAP
jgi:polyisoprenoid-binding protein YceI